MPVSRPASAAPPVPAVFIDGGAASAWAVALQNVVELFDWAIVAQEFFNGPDMVGWAGCHGGRSVQAVVNGIEVVDDASPEQFGCEALSGACRTGRATHQGWHAGTEGGVEAFDLGGVDEPKADLCGGNEFIGGFRQP